MESIYYIVEGTMLFKGDDGVETVLEAGDSVHIAPHSKKVRYKYRYNNRSDVSSSFTGSC